jgi:pimeloyl-ACP methyl ester carboxylesterase
LLQAQGHRVTLIDLPGRNGTAEELAKLSAEDYVAAVLKILDLVSEPVVLVGHSLGGGTISLAAEARPEKIKTLVYLTAFLVPSGLTMGSIAVADKQSLTPKAARRDAKTGVSSLDPAFVREVFYQDCSDADVALALRRVSSESGAMGRAPIRTTAQRFGSVDRVFIECLRDRAISIDVQRSMVAALPCRKTLTLDTGHSPFLSNPQGLAAALTSIA